MKAEVKTSMKEFISAQGIEFDLDYDEDVLKEIKKDYFKLAEEYVSLFQEFRQHFKEFSDEELGEKVQKFIEGHNVIYSKLRNIMSPLNSKSVIERNVYRFVMENELNITNFFYLCLEVYEE